MKRRSIDVVGASGPVVFEDEKRAPICSGIPVRASPQNSAQEAIKREDW